MAGYNVPKNTQVLIDLNAVLKDEKLFPNPDEFEPGRFLDDSSGRFVVNRDRIRANFGFGLRRCPGEKIAMDELYIFLCWFLRMFRMSASDLNDKKKKEHIFKGYFGLNHVPMPFKMKFNKIHD